MSRKPFDMSQILTLTSGRDANALAKVVHSLARIVKRQGERIARLEARLADAANRSRE